MFNDRAKRVDFRVLLLLAMLVAFGGFTTMLALGMSGPSKVSAQVTTETLGAATGNSPNLLVCVPPPAGISSWWPGDGNADDIVGGSNGVLEGGVTFAEGTVDEAFSLGGLVLQRRFLWQGDFRE